MKAHLRVPQKRFSTNEMPESSINSCSDETLKEDQKVFIIQEILKSIQTQVQNQITALIFLREKRIPSLFYALGLHDRKKIVQLPDNDSFEMILKKILNDILCSEDESLDFSHEELSNIGINLSCKEENDLYQEICDFFVEEIKKDFKKNKCPKSRLNLILTNIEKIKDFCEAAQIEPIQSYLKNVLKKIEKPLQNLLLDFVDCEYQQKLSDLIAIFIKFDLDVSTLNNLFGSENKKSANFAIKSFYSALELLFEDENAYLNSLNFLIINNNRLKKEELLYAKFKNAIILKMIKYANEYFGTRNLDSLIPLLINNRDDITMKYYTNLQESSKKPFTKSYDQVKEFLLLCNIILQE